MPTENTAEIILHQQWHIKTIDKQKKSHTARENHPVSHKKCKKHRNNFTGCWKGSWDVKVTLPYWIGCKITSSTHHLTPQIFNCSLRTRCEERSQSSSLWSALAESMGWAVAHPYLKVVVALESTFRFIWPPGRDSFKTGMRASIFHNVCFKQQHLFQMCKCHFKTFWDYFTLGE